MYREIIHVCHVTRVSEESVVVVEVEDRDRRGEGENELEERKRG